MRRSWAVLALAAALLVGCADAQQEQTVTVAPGGGIRALDVDPAVAVVFLATQREAWTKERRGGKVRRQIGVVLATSRDKDSWQASVMTDTGVDAIVTDWLSDPSIADLLVQAGDVISYYDRPDGSVTVGDCDYRDCENLARLHVLAKRAVPTSTIAPSPRASRDRPAVRASRSRPSYEVWADTADARTVVRCESSDVGIHGIDVNAGVPYYGKWQADPDFVRTYDGTTGPSWVRAGRFSMPEWRQDRMAYRGYLARGWQPWTCARILGIR